MEGTPLGAATISGRYALPALGSTVICACNAEGANKQEKPSPPNKTFLSIVLETKTPNKAALSSLFSYLMF